MMRPFARPSSPLRLVALVVVCALVVVAGVWFWLSRDGEGAEVVGESRAGWTTIQYQDVRVDIPASWERSDRDDCEFQFELWAPPDGNACDWESGVAFYASATFDPGDKPGVRRSTSRGDPEWGGYTYVGDFAVYASDDDRATVQRVLRSAE
jgi:hypothetical protein